MTWQEYGHYADITFEICESLRDFREHLGRMVSERSGLLGEVDEVIDSLQKLVDEFTDLEDEA